MKEILSKVDMKPVAVLYAFADMNEEGESRTEPAVLMQVAAKVIPAEKIFAAHAHLPCERATVGTQEAWVVIRGLVEVDIYDIDDYPLECLGLRSGDCLLLLRGGHAMRTLVPTTLYEFKTGPYNGKEKDKRMIDP